MRVCLLASLQGDQKTARMTGGCFDVRLSISGQRTLFFSIGLVAIQCSTASPQASPISPFPQSTAQGTRSNPPLQNLTMSHGEGRVTDGSNGWARG